MVGYFVPKGLNSLGVCINREEIWMKRLEEVKKYINENKKRPSNSDNNKNIKQLSSWVSIQIQNYKTKKQIKHK